MGKRMPYAVGQRLAYAVAPMSYVVHNQHDTGVASHFDDLNEARAFYYIEGCRLRKKYPKDTSWAFLSLSEATFGGDEGKCLEIDSEWPPEDLGEWKDDWSDDLVATAQAASDKLAVKYEEQERKWREQNPPRPLKRKVVVELPATANKRARTHSVELSMEHDAEVVAKWVAHFVGHSMDDLCVDQLRAATVTITT
jgi:hypothetical protein